VLRWEFEWAERVHFGALGRNRCIRGEGVTRAVGSFGNLAHSGEGEAHARWGLIPLAEASPTLGGRRVFG